MVSAKRSGKCDARPVTEEDGGGKRGAYEESRAQRMKENIERLKSLGIFQLCKNLKPSKPQSLRVIKCPTRPNSSNDPPRRSSRLNDMPRVTYAEVKTRVPKGKNHEIYRRSLKKKKIPEICTEEDEKLLLKTGSTCMIMLKKNIAINERKNMNIFCRAKSPVFRVDDNQSNTTSFFHVLSFFVFEEDEKLLGDSVNKWALFVDGYDKDGQRIYDPVEEKYCHQCRQKSLGHHTECSKCKMAAGQFCGNCLYKRYGENVIEANAKPNWMCPVCRGICNCSLCRRDKGWASIGLIYKKVTSLGYKSVAHYLIQTRRGPAHNEA